MYRKTIVATIVLVSLHGSNSLAAEPVQSDELIRQLDPKLQMQLDFRSLTRADTGPLTVDLEILFAFDSAELLGEATEQLDELGKALSSDDLVSFHFRIVGHTDAVGSEVYNLNLSERRAESVKTYLIKRFTIDGNRLVAAGLGETRLNRAWKA